MSTAPETPADECLTALSVWIDTSPGYVGLATETHQRRRIDKIAEEYGEVAQAYGGMVGENPRKGVTHQMSDVLGELLDVAITALGAHEHLTGNQGGSLDALDAKIRWVAIRAGVTS